MPLRVCRQRAGSCGNTRAELAPTRYRGGSCRTGRTQPGVLAKTAGRSIKRTVQPRDSRLDRYSWESPTVGKTRQSRDIRRSSIHLEKAGACREAKGMLWQMFQIFQILISAGGMFILFEVLE